MSINYALYGHIIVLYKYYQNTQSSIKDNSHEGQILLFGPMVSVIWDKEAFIFLNRSWQVIREIKKGHLKLQFLTVHLLASNFLLLECMYYEDRALILYRLSIIRSYYHL